MDQLAAEKLADDEEFDEEDVLALLDEAEQDDEEFSEHGSSAANGTEEQAHSERAGPHRYNPTKSCSRLCLL